MKWVGSCEKSVPVNIFLNCWLEHLRAHGVTYSWCSDAAVAMEQKHEGSGDHTGPWVLRPRQAALWPPLPLRWFLCLWHIWHCRPLPTGCHISFQGDLLNSRAMRSWEIYAATQHYKAGSWGESWHSQLELLVFSICRLCPAHKELAAFFSSLQTLACLFLKGWLILAVFANPLAGIHPLKGRGQVPVTGVVMWFQRPA